MLLTSIHTPAVNFLQTPLDSSSVDVAVFCLSLMGTNYQSYLEESYRLLKPGFVFFRMDFSCSGWTLLPYSGFDLV